MGKLSQTRFNHRQQNVCCLYRLLRENFYKSLISLLLVFLILQYGINIFIYKKHYLHPFLVSVSNSSSRTLSGFLHADHSLLMSSIFGVPYNASVNITRRWNSSDFAPKPRDPTQPLCPVIPSHLGCNQMLLYEDKVQRGPDLETYSNITAENCSKLCLENMQCVAASFDVNVSPECWLHHGNGAIENRKQALLFKKDCSGCHMVSYKGQVQMGPDMLVIANITSEQCKAACQIDEKCQSSTWDNKDGSVSCFMHNKQKARSKQKNAVHFRKICESNKKHAVKISSSRPSFKELATKYPDVEIGGRWNPTNCTSHHKVAIIIPYRDRAEHLRVFLNNMHPFLQKQGLDYGIYIIEEAPPTKFNRAMLMNIGFNEAKRMYNYDCYIFHDVDLLPEDDRNLYTCPESPRHMSAAVDSLGYRLPYIDIFGGVSAMKREHFEKINGFSNMFWGWGGEDDDLAARVKHHKLKITRYPMEIARYKMIKHAKDTPNPSRFKILLDGWKRFKSDGLNSLQYKVLDIRLEPLYTLINVDLAEAMQSASERLGMKTSTPQPIFLSHNSPFPYLQNFLKRNGKRMSMNGRAIFQRNSLQKPPQPRTTVSGKD
ncbi:unnamed protein product [Owenia fusiformis]|uniref:Uncharacterized protein n=1 Tax=Owenia fusiformis TaxID=6347 RepID=A0A8J1TBC7_OWEFU|nr:unnamed protein product [Owenia fusiformis]